MPGVLAIITTDNADKLRLDGKAAAGDGSRCCKATTCCSTASMSPWSSPRRCEQAQAAAARVVVRYRPAEAVTMMDAVLSQAYHAEAVPQRPAAARHQDAAIPTAR